MPTESLVYFVQWIGSSAGLQLIVTRLLPRIPWFRAQPGKTRLLIVAILSIILPQVTWLLGARVPSEVWNNLEPNFQLLVQSVNVVATWFAGEAGYQVNEKVKELRAG